MKKCFVYSEVPKIRYSLGEISIIVTNQKIMKLPIAIISFNLLVLDYSYPIQH